MSHGDVQDVIHRMLTATPPALPQDEAARLALEHYGIEARLEPLVSDRDQNFRLDAGDGRRFVLKIANQTDPPASLDFQNQALSHVARRDPSLPVPSVVPNRQGEGLTRAESGGDTHVVRVLSWLEGVPAEHHSPAPGFDAQLGALLARLGLALADFTHPAADRWWAWDLQHFAGLRVLLEHIRDPALERLADDVLGRFETRVQPVMDTLRTQVVHSDMNLGNILLEKGGSGHISGIIDFGDLVTTPLVFDLAIAAAYRLGAGDDPLAGALPLIGGFHGQRPLQPLEMELLTDLIRARLVTSLLINSYRVKLFPENRDYLLVSYAAVKTALAGLDRLGNDEALTRIEEACPTRSA